MATPRPLGWLWFVLLAIGLLLAAVFIVPGMLSGRGACFVPKQGSPGGPISLECASGRTGRLPTRTQTLTLSGMPDGESAGRLTVRFASHAPVTSTARFTPAPDGTVSVVIRTPEDWGDATTVSFAP